MASDTTHAELHKYLEEKKLNALFVSIVEAILVDKPDNPISLMVQPLIDRFPEETKELTEKLQLKEKPPSLVVAKTDVCEEMSDTNSDCSSVNTSESVAPSTRHEDTSSSAKPPQRKKRRESVCAEKIADTVVEESELKVISKTEAEAARIQETMSLKSNVFFSHLDEHQMQTIQNVMFNVDKSDGDVIITQGDE